MQDVLPATTVRVLQYYKLRMVVLKFGVVLLIVCCTVLKGIVQNMMCNVIVVAHILVRMPRSFVIQTVV